MLPLNLSKIQCWHWRNIKSSRNMMTNLCEIYIVFHYICHFIWLIAVEQNIKCKIIERKPSTKHIYTCKHPQFFLQKCNEKSYIIDYSSCYHISLTTTHIIVYDWPQLELSDILAHDSCHRISLTMGHIIVYIINHDHPQTQRWDIHQRKFRAHKTTSYV